MKDYYRFAVLFIACRHSLAFSPSVPKWSTSSSTGRFGVATSVEYRSAASVETPSIDSSAPGPADGSLYDYFSEAAHRRKSPVVGLADPALVEFASFLSHRPAPTADDAAQQALQSLTSDWYSRGFYPFAAMMQGSAPYIAAHAGQAAVFHIPGELLEHPESQNLLSDIALAWLLGMKIVIVAGCRSNAGHCDLDHAHECHNMLTVMDSSSLRHVEEEAGYLRTELERKLNRCLRTHGGVLSSKDSPSPEGNVVSGNFYTAQRFGRIRGEDFGFTGFATSVHVNNINDVLKNNDIVVLTAVGMSPLGELVNVNSYHLAATVAASLNAHKLVYMANEGSVLQCKGDKTPIQELPISFAQSIVDYHRVEVHNTGFATFEQARKVLEPSAVELLIHLAWSTWAVSKGVRRAHIVNPSDGALLEEIFTTKNGANTCLYHDDENKVAADALGEEDWDRFFAAAAEQGQTVHAVTPLLVARQNGA